jgi:alpha-D-ribose 1-methylphosphonate 5-triphosphate synthase subunit PhnH
MYQFYPTLTEHDQDALRQAPIGTYEVPDQAATLVIGCGLESGTRLRLIGPGINGSTELRVSDLPRWFWPLRAERIRYPLGWDVFLVGGDRVVGLPRTTTVEVW